MTSTVGPDPFAEELLDRAVIGLASGKRLAFWGYDKTVFAGLARLTLLKDAEFCMVSDWEGHHHFHLFGRPITPPDALSSFHPDEILVIKREGAHAVFDQLIALGFAPRQVVLHSGAWNERLVVRDPLFPRLLASIPKAIEGGLSGPEVTVHAFEALRYVVQRKIPGDIVNLGVFQGWSMYFFALGLELLNDEQGRRVIGFDTFDGFMSTGNDYDHFVEYQCGLGKTGWNFFRNTSQDVVAANLERFPNVELVKGDIRVTLGHLADRHVALALFDMDDYIPPKAALEPVYDRMPPGGALVFDHFACQTLAEGSAVGQRLAMLEFLDRNPGLFNLTGTNVFLR